MTRPSNLYAAFCVVLAGCATATPGTKADLNAAFSVAAAGEAA